MVYKIALNLKCINHFDEKFGFFFKVAHFAIHSQLFSNTCTLKKSLSHLLWLYRYLFFLFFFYVHFQSIFAFVSIINKCNVYTCKIPPEYVSERQRETQYKTRKFHLHRQLNGHKLIKVKYLTDYKICLVLITLKVL